MCHSTRCAVCWTAVKSYVKGLTVLLALMTYHLLCFTAFVSLSIGFSQLVGWAYEYFLSGTFPNAAEAFVCMYLISIFSEFHIFCQQECIGNAMRAYNRIHGYILFYGSVFIYVVLYFFAFAQLYIQFETVHKSHKDAKEVQRLTKESPTGILPLEKTGFSYYDKLHTACFLLALAFLMYCTSKLIHYDIIRQLKRINAPSSCAHCVMILAFFGLHFIVNILYSIPLLIVAFSVKEFTNTGGMAFIQINLVAVMLGVIFAVIETRKPWPTIRGQGPFFCYENNARAKAVLGQFQVIWILICFYGPNTSGKISQKEFHAGNNSVIYFCFAVAFNVLHFVKILVFICLSKRQPEEPEDLAAGFQIVRFDQDIALIEDGEDDGNAIVVPNCELELSPFSRQSNTSQNTHENKENSNESGNNNNNAGQIHLSETSPKVSELLAVRNATESVSDFKLPDLAKLDEEMMKKIVTVESSLILENNSVCTQTEDAETGFLAVGIEGDDSEIWRSGIDNTNTNNIETKDDNKKMVSLVIGNISEVEIIEIVELEKQSREEMESSSEMQKTDSNSNLDELRNEKEVEDKK